MNKSRENITQMADVCASIATTSNYVKKAPFLLQMQFKREFLVPRH